MRIIFAALFSIIILLLQGGPYNYHSQGLFPPPDSLPPPPPGNSAPLNGPASACVGETSQYTIDVPVNCICQWSVDGILQTGSSSDFMITWTEPGLHEISVIFICSGGLMSEPETLTVSVFEIPQSQPITGENPVCEYTYHTYSTIIGEGDSCQWTVNGVIQPGYASSIEYAFGASGNYHFEVIAFNPCGSSSPQTLDVTAQGTAPAPPSPIEGPGQSCTGITDIYTTTVGPGESCAWRVDGILQASTTTTLEITWAEWGEHIIEVRSVSGCGTGNPTYKTVDTRYQPDVFLGNDTTILQGQTLILDAGNPGQEYLWSTGETTQTITVSLAGEYSVNVSGFCGSDSDTIEISVAIWIKENNHAGDCFNLATRSGSIYFSDLPLNFKQLQIFSITGALVYEGEPKKEILVNLPGIYFVRVISPETACVKKVAVP